MVIDSKEIKIENILMKTNTWIDITKRILIVRTMMKTVENSNSNTQQIGDEWQTDKSNERKKRHSKEDNTRDSDTGEEDDMMFSGSSRSGNNNCDDQDSGEMESSGRGDKDGFLNE
jgi:hypothetical protein